MKRFIIVIIACLIMGGLIGVATSQIVGTASDGVIVQKTPLFNFGDFLHSMRAGYGIDQHGQKSEVFYAAVMTFHTEKGVDLVSLNVGYEGIKKRPTIMTGIRLDNIVPLLFNGVWGKAHVKTASLPTFEFGPFISFWPKDSSNLWRLSVRYGVGAAVGF